MLLFLSTPHRAWAGRGKRRPFARAYGRLIEAYQVRASPHLGQRCRFEPTCSDYILEATRVEGVLMCLVRTSDRLQRCHPWADPYYASRPNGRLLDPYPPAVKGDKPVKRILCSLASAILPGAGQALAGRWSDGAVSFCLVAIPTAMAVAMEEEDHEEVAVALGAVSAFFHSGNILGAYQALPPDLLE